MPTQTTDLYLLEDLEDSGRTSQLAEGDRHALRAVADWIKAFVVRPHADLGRPGPVCPFVPEALERRTLWLAPEQVAGRGLEDVVELMKGYRRLLLDTEPTVGDGADYRVIVVVFTDLPADRAQAVFGDVLEQLAVPSYVEDGIVFGPFYEGNEGTAIYKRELPTVPVTRSVSVREARGGRRLEVLPGRRGDDRPLGASLRRVSDPRSRRGAAPPPLPLV